MGKKSPKPPAQPSPQATAEAQQTGVISPYGNISFGTVTDGKFTPRSGFNAYQLEETPFQRQMRMLQEGILTGIGQRTNNNLNNMMPQNLDYSQFAALPTYEQFALQGEQARKTAFDQAMGLLNPEFERQQKSLNQGLADRGLPLGSEAYSDATGLLAQQQNDARQRAAFEAVDVGRAEQDRQLSRALGLRESAIQDFLRGRDVQRQNRGDLLTEYGSVSGIPFQNIPQPQLQNAGVANQIAQNYAAAYGNYQNQVANYNQRMGQIAQLGMMALGGLGGAGGPLGGSNGFFGGAVGATGPQIPGLGGRIIGGFIPGF